MGINADWFAGYVCLLCFDVGFYGVCLIVSDFFVVFIIEVLYY